MRVTEKKIDGNDYHFHCKVQRGGYSGKTSIIEPQRNVDDDICSKFAPIFQPKDQEYKPKMQVQWLKYRFPKTQ